MVDQVLTTVGRAVGWLLEFSTAVAAVAAVYAVVCMQFRRSLGSFIACILYSEYLLYDVLRNLKSCLKYRYRIATDRYVTLHYVTSLPRFYHVWKTTLRCLSLRAD
jgi:hypothetical protein